VGYTATLTAVLTASLMNGQNANLWIAILVALALGLLVGSANGFLAAYVKLPPLIVTLSIALKDMGSNYVMPSIAAAVVGGVSMSGGEGNYFGVILGAIFLQTLTNLLVAIGLGDAGKWLGFGIVLFTLLIVFVSDRRVR
jgi:ribose transport system permease protein